MHLDIPESKLPRLVIVGGGFAGIKLAQSLCREQVQIVLLDQHNYHSFQPLLYQVATSGLGVDNIAYPIRKIFQNQQNFFFRMTEVTGVHPQEKKLSTQIGDLSYDYLVIATGSETNFFGNEGLMINAMPMKTIPESLALRSMILQNFEKALTLQNDRKKKSLLNYVIAGGGPTGVELAGALGELKKHILPIDYPELNIEQMQIYLIQSDKRLLPMFSESSSIKAKQYLEKLGVKVMLETRVLDYNGDFVQINGTEEIFAKTLIWTAGVVGAPIEGLPIEALTKNQRIKVDSFQRVLGAPDVFAVGDVACMISEKQPSGHPMVAQVAIQQGKNLANNLIRLLQKQDMVPFSYKDKGSMATVGKNKALAELNKLKISGSLGWFLWLFVHLLFLVGFRNKILVVINWMSNYFTYDRGIRLIVTPFNLNSAKRKRKQKLEEELMILQQKSS